MKYSLILLVFLSSIVVNAQNIQVDSQTYTPQQLIEDILINNSCITNVNVTNYIGGDFEGSDQSYGYFDASGSSFPFQEGIVLSTGRLSNVGGPNTTLSSDDAVNWNGDTDLETALNESNTTNATIIEFDFTSIANQVSFNYIFASEEYQEDNSNTCDYSDLFGFLIRPINDSNYTNIALVPNTQIPVKVTTIHPLIPNGCAAQNEMYFESWNDSSAPINFNGQTKVLTATATTIPNETYHVKLVIADEQNHLYDSAVFLEAGSFKLSTDLSEDRLYETNNPLCFGETLDLDAFTSGANVTYKWFKNAIELPLDTNNIYTVSEPGVYNVEVSLGNNCISYGEITIDYAQELDTNQNYLSSCDNDDDGFTFFDLHLADPFYKVDMTGLTVVDYFLTPEHAANNSPAIVDQSVFFNTELNQVVYARIENEYGCFTVESLTLTANYTSISVSTFEVCDENIDGITTFNLSELRSQIKPELSSLAYITFFTSYNDAAYHQNQLPDSYENTTPNSQEIWVKSQDIFCELLTTIKLIVNAPTELLSNQEITFCLNNNLEIFKINAGFLNEIPSDDYSFEWKKDGIDVGINQYEIELTEAGLYTVKVTNLQGCTSERSIDVNISESAIVDAINIEDLDGYNTVTFLTSGEGIYEYAIDTDELFQESSIFSDVNPGNHTIFIRDINGCPTKELTVTVASTFPKFFTPNSDSYNDTWNPSIDNIGGNLHTKIYIFDRFGKLLKELNPYGYGWDGTFNGIPLPSADYWFKIILENGKVFNGHFSLKR